MTAFAAPCQSVAGRLVPAFDEDDVTLAWDAVHAAGLAPGARLASDLALPAWWWQGTGLTQDPACERRLRLAHTASGPVAAVLGPDARAEPEALAAAALALATPIDDATAQRIARARDAPDGEADFPLGASVSLQRHEQLLPQRMQARAGKVLSWTTIGAGAAPSEFTRLQDAVGAYHVVLIAWDGGGRTVGIWSEGQAPATGQPVRPVLRRLYRTQGAWRYGVKFAPADSR